VLKKKKQEALRNFLLLRRGNVGQSLFLYYTRNALEIPATMSEKAEKLMAFLKLLYHEDESVYFFPLMNKIKLKEYNDMIDSIKDEAVGKIKLKQAEEDIKTQFTDDIENMTQTQGRILLKLIYRQTGVTPYEIVKELRGSLRAIFWQTIARVFGNNLKVEYDPVGEDKAIEEIIQQIENGKL